MFGVIISGRMVQTECQWVTENQLLFNIPDSGAINHAVVFMTGQNPFSDGLGGAVYFSWPNVDGPSWLLIGHITNEKPSAIFKIANLQQSAEHLAGDMNGEISFGRISKQLSHHVQIGISIEPLSQLVQQTPFSSSGDTSVLPSMVEFSSKMLEGFFNYVASFAVNQSQMIVNPCETFVPLSCVNTWFDNFKRRLQQNPYFWKS